MQAKPSAFDRINVRRLFIVLEKAISRAARYFLFEFNDAFTRAQFVAMVEPYLRMIQGRRGITGFKVVCDETNNPPEVEANGDLLIDVFLDPTRYTKRIHICATVPRVGEIEFALQLIDKQAA
jgi:phage tail sheath protein FI